MSERDEDEESLFNELSMNDFDSEEQYEPLDLELEGIGMGRVVRTPSNSISLSIDFENEGEGDVNMENILTSLELRRTNRHTFMCNWGMVICTLLPLLILLTETVYVCLLVWVTLTDQGVSLPEHEFWNLELSFLVLQNVQGLSIISFMFLVVVLRIRLQKLAILAGLVALVLVNLSSGIWSYRESSHNHYWFPASFAADSIWLKPIRFLQLKVGEISTVSIMILLWIYHWEEVLELHGTHGPAPPEPCLPDEPLPTVPTSESPASTCRGLYSITIPRQVTNNEPEPPSSSSPEGLQNSGIKLTGTGFEVQAEDNKSQAEFREGEDGDRPGVAQPSRILPIGS